MDTELEMWTILQKELIRRVRRVNLRSRLIGSRGHNFKIYVTISRVGYTHKLSILYTVFLNNFFWCGTITVLECVNFKSHSYAELKLYSREKSGNY